jgi:glutathione synthase/RimK-type ligase-like ATP-grasp enzyme
MVVATVHWPWTLRLCFALSASGFSVGAVTPPDHGIRKLKAAAYCAPHRYSGVMASIAAAIDTWSPDILMPCDEPAAYWLHELYAQASHKAGDRSTRIRELIQTSLGDPASFDIVRRKSEFIAIAAREGIAVPDTTTVHDIADLNRQLAAADYPLVLKTDASWGGIGVRIVRTPEDAERAFSELARQCGWRYSLKQAAKKQTFEPLARRFHMPRQTISLQRYIEGWPACRTVACRQGEVLAGLSLRALQTKNETGPSTVVRAIDNPEMVEISQHMTCRLGLSGMVGFDFVIEASSGRAYLIEMNARSTPTAHLSLDEESNLTGALAASFGGVAKAQADSAITSDTIALFPQELWRDPQSQYLHRVHHDVPWDNPKFVAAYLLPISTELPAWLGRLRRPAQALGFSGRFKDATDDPTGAPTRPLQSLGAYREPL